MKTTTLVFAVVVFASSVFAQSHHLKVKLDVGNDDELSRKIVNRVAAQIGHELANRMAKQCAQGLCDTGAQYTPPAQEERPDILVTVTCMHDFCASNLDYWPIRGLGLHAALDNCIAEGSETELAQRIFEHFVQNTEDERLASASRRFKMLLNQAINIFPKGVK